MPTMLLLLLKRIPIRDYLYAAAAIAAVVYYNAHVHSLEVNYAAKKALAEHVATEKATKAAEEAYAINLAKVEDNYETLIAQDAAAHSADIDRLRKLAAARSKLGGSASAGSTSGQGDSSSEGLGLVPAELGAELADALRTTRDQRDSCYAERDSLTGK